MTSGYAKIITETNVKIMTKIQHTTHDRMLCPNYEESLCRSHEVRACPNHDRRPTSSLSQDHGEYLMGCCAKIKTGELVQIMTEDHAQITTGD